MRIIGITGGIGSGKSTVSKILETLGVEVMDADKTAREVVKKGEQVLSLLSKKFGSDILTSEGELDRKKLGDIVFSDPEKLKILNNITHKEIIKRINERIKVSKSPIVAIDAAIPQKEGFLDIAEEIWTVAADKEIRAKRIMQRNNMTLKEAQERINSQISENDYISIAKRVLYNNGEISLLEKTVREYFEDFLNKKCR